jgi:hypothetical protein
VSLKCGATHLQAYAAEKAGWHAALADRPGNKALPEGHHFPVVNSLYKLLDGTDKFAFPKDIQVCPLPSHIHISLYALRVRVHTFSLLLHLTICCLSVDDLASARQ